MQRIALTASAAEWLRLENFIKMPVYFFPIIIFTCLLYHLLFGRKRLRMIEALPFLLNQKEANKRMISFNITLSTFAVFLCMIVSLVHTFFPEQLFLILPFKIMNSRILDYIGMFFVKIAFISKIVVYIQVSDKLALDFHELTTQRIKKMETLIMATTLILAMGVFIYISSIISLISFLAVGCAFAHKLIRS